MASVRGREDVRRYIAGLPDQLRDRVLRGAARAAGQIVAEEAKTLCASEEVASAVVVRSKREDDKITVFVTVKGAWERSVANWLEYGTTAHFIAVDKQQREGRSVARINKLSREGSLRINGRFVGSTVHHPGARPHPFLRPALDLKEGDAIAAAQSYINARISRAGIAGGSERAQEA